MELAPRLGRVRRTAKEAVLFVVCDSVNLGVETHPYNLHFVDGELAAQISPVDPTSSRRGVDA